MDAKANSFLLRTFLTYSFYREKVNDFKKFIIPTLAVLVLRPVPEQDLYHPSVFWTWLKNQTKWKSPFSSLSLRKYQFTLRSPLIRYERIELTNNTSVITTLIQVQWNEQYNDNLAPVQIKIRVFDLRRAILWKFYFRFWNSELNLAMRLLSSYWKSIGRCNDFQKKISWWDTIYMI